MEIWEYDGHQKISILVIDKIEISKNVKQKVWTRIKWLLTS